ncbi:hypothetical protein DVT68_15030 [Dyella solisilvae]|uniref:Uncharacterized protein n=1 Tax=Dyella solisilvae TaxID=1920168 RepID=A0A370K4N1_9GAMM|nr:hypothetical protein DVT68_15030 [Dyella solisilvae]
MIARLRSRAECAPTGAAPLLALGSWLFALGSSLLALRSWLFALGSWLLALGSWFFALAFDFHSPMARRVGGGIARRVAGRDAGQFVVRAGCPVDKPRNPPANLEGVARKACHRGGLSFGYFSLATQRKVTRCPAGLRKPAAGEQAGGNPKSKAKVTGSLLPQG